MKSEKEAAARAAGFIHSGVNSDSPQIQRVTSGAGLQQTQGDPPRFSGDHCFSWDMGQ